MGIEAEETKVIRADSDVIWDLLARPDAWRTWWPGCVAARTLDDRPAHHGTVDVHAHDRAGGRHAAAVRLPRHDRALRKHGDRRRTDTDDLDHQRRVAVRTSP